MFDCCSPLPFLTLMHLSFLLPHQIYVDDFRPLPFMYAGCTGVSVWNSYFCFTSSVRHFGFIPLPLVERLEWHQREHSKVTISGSDCGYVWCQGSPHGVHQPQCVRDGPNEFAEDAPNSAIAANGAVESV